ncbi:MAG: hypothetical protein ACRYF7_22195 [Janthinobacterium lividum]
MRVKIRILRKEGRLLWASSAESKAPGHMGMLVIDEKRNPAFGRILTRAKLCSITAGYHIDLIPELLDVQVLWAREQMRLAGFERIADVDYAQMWAIEVLPGLKLTVHLPIPHCDERWPVTWWCRYSDGRHRDE